MIPGDSDPRPRDKVLAYIVGAGVRPGEQIPPESTLASLIGVSRPTLREALALLEADGILTRRHGLGTFVSPVTKEAVRKLIDAREMVELYVGAALIERGWVEAGFEAWDQARQRLLGDVPPEEMWVSQMNFHFEMIKLLNNEIIEKQYKDIINRLEMVYLFTEGVVYRKEQINEEHMAIMESVRNRDMAGFTEITRKHISSAAEYYDGPHDARLQRAAITVPVGAHGS